MPVQRQFTPAIEIELEDDFIIYSSSNETEIDNEENRFDDDDQESNKENRDPKFLLSNKIRRREFTYKERIKVKTLREAGWTFRRISDYTNISLGSVYTLCTTPTTPKKRNGRPESLDEDTRRMLINFIQQSSINRRMTFREVGMHCGMNLSTLLQYSFN